MKRQDSAISDICHRGHRLYLILWRKLLFCGEWPSNGRIERSHLVWFGGVWIGEEEIITVQRDLNNITSFLGCCSMTIMIYKGPTTYQIITFVGPPLKLHFSQSTFELLRNASCNIRLKILLPWNQNKNYNNCRWWRWWWQWWLWFEVETVSMPADSHSSFIHLTNSLSGNKFVSKSFFLDIFVLFKRLLIFTNLFAGKPVFCYHAHLSLLPAAIWGSLLNSLR